jgi:hypothetical protein
MLTRPADSAGDFWAAYVRRAGRYAGWCDVPRYRLPAQHTLKSSQYLSPFRPSARDATWPVHCLSRGCLIVETLARLRSCSCIIDGEAVCCGDDGVPSFDRIRYRRQDVSVFVYEFDAIERDDLPASRHRERRNRSALPGRGRPRDSSG